MTELLVNYKHKNVISQKSQLYKNVISVPRHTLISAVWAHIAHTGSPHHNPCYSFTKSTQAFHRKFPRKQQALTFSCIPGSNGGTPAFPCERHTCPWARPGLHPQKGDLHRQQETEPDPASRATTLTV